MSQTPKWFRASPLCLLVSSCLAAQEPRSSTQPVVPWPTGVSANSQVASSQEDLLRSVAEAGKVVLKLEKLHQRAQKQCEVAATSMDEAVEAWGEASKEFAQYDNKSQALQKEAQEVVLRKGQPLPNEVRHYSNYEKQYEQEAKNRLAAANADLLVAKAQQEALAPMRLKLQSLHAVMESSKSQRAGEDESSLHYELLIKASSLFNDLGGDEGRLRTQVVAEEKNVAELEAKAEGLLKSSGSSSDLWESTDRAAKQAAARLSSYRACLDLAAASGKCAASFEELSRCVENERNASFILGRGEEWLAQCMARAAAQMQGKTAGGK